VLIKNEVLSDIVPRHLVNRDVRDECLHIQGDLSSFCIRKELVLASSLFGIRIFTPMLIRGVVASTRTSYSLGSGFEFNSRYLFPDWRFFFISEL